MIFGYITILSFFGIFYIFVKHLTFMLLCVKLINTFNIVYNSTVIWDYFFISVENYVKKQIKGENPEW